MPVDGYYYLHENGDLIYKREFDGTAADLRESDFVRELWPVDTRDRETAWELLIEALAAGAKRGRVDELAAKWGCDDADAAIFAERVGIVLDRDGDQWFARCSSFVDLQSSHSGFGSTCLEAMADLARSFFEDKRWRRGKLWGQSFVDRVKAE